MAIFVTLFKKFSHHLNFFISLAISKASAVVLIYLVEGTNGNIAAVSNTANDKFFREGTLKKIAPTPSCHSKIY